MHYLSVTEIAKKWDMSERSVRNYCAQGRVNGAFLTGKTWNIPEKAEKPSVPIKKNSSQLHCWTFCKSRRQVNMPVASTIKHRSN